VSAFPTPPEESDFQYPEDVAKYPIPGFPVSWFTMSGMQAGADNPSGRWSSEKGLTEILPGA
jgi:hypothetical protein